MPLEISKRMEAYLALARNVAKQSENQTCKHGAVLVSGKNVVNTAFNSSRFHSFADRFLADPTRKSQQELEEAYGPYKVKYPIHGTLHAEIGAILNQPFDVTHNADVWVVRVSKKNKLVESYPCPMCQAAMIHCGIRRVYYSTKDGGIECINFRAHTK